jgi:hypothetical protein
MITVIGGRPGSAKSLLGIRMAADVAKKGNVILSQSEDHVRAMVGPRLSAIKARKSRIDVLEETPHFPDDAEYIRKKIIRSNVKLAIFDPVNEHLSEGVKRQTDSVRKASRPLKKIAEETGCAIVLFDHVLKSIAANSHPLNAIGGGSSGLVAAGRMVYIIGRDPEDNDRVLWCCVKPGVRDMPEPYEFTMDEDEVDGVRLPQPLLIDQGECPDYDVMKTLVKPGKKGKMGRPPTKREAALEFIIEYLGAAPNHERKASEITEDAKHYGITKRTLDGAKAEINIVSSKRGKEWFWKLPQELIDTLDEST